MLCVCMLSYHKSIHTSFNVKALHIKVAKQIAAEIIVARYVPGRKMAVRILSEAGRKPFGSHLRDIQLISKFKITPDRGCCPWMNQYGLQSINLAWP